ncbi:hypothetical protein L873DRAFT_1832084 [Choiromyces venosus 120613-1]|uniref:Uncharacterized protein n=1 Tax=Choiromyces venosus 120613-1 TaxID=1336337 RepID=A0A3N4IWC1_9PEZI|nr:hypothetical protein L873DRAFT_1832084 [Choiromyces venosus 120613-1]
MAYDLLDDFFSTPVRPSHGSTQFGTPPPVAVTAVAGGSQGHHRPNTNTTFDDLLGLFDSQSITAQKPKPAQVLSLAHPGRPVSFHGSTTMNRADPFATFGNITNRTVTPAPRPASIATFDDFFATVPVTHGNGSVNGNGFGTTLVSQQQQEEEEEEEEEDDDDFGDFTSAPASGGSVLTPPLTARTAFSSPPPSRGSNSSPPPPPTPPKPKYIRSRKVSDADPFGDFVASPSTTSPPRLSFGSPPRMPSIPLKAFASIPAPSPYRRPTKPVEILPVAVLLRAFPPLFLLPQEQLLDKMKDLSFPLRQRVLSHHKTKEFLEAICEVGRVAGRIVAGRKRRAKSTLPGKAGGGMKLANGTGATWQQKKEDREVKEICRLWKEGSGRLKAAMGAGIPEFEDEPFKGPGRQECKLCRLGKDELLPGLKEKTERLGWWDREWGGHAGCKGFWENHGKGLVSMGNEFVGLS